MVGSDDETNPRMRVTEAMDRLAIPPEMQLAFHSMLSLRIDAIEHSCTRWRIRSLRRLRIVVGTAGTLAEIVESSNGIMLPAEADDISYLCDWMFGTNVPDSDGWCDGTKSFQQQHQTIQEEHALEAFDSHVDLRSPNHWHHHK